MLIVLSPCAHHPCKLLIQVSVKLLKKRVITGNLNYVSSYRRDNYQMKFLRKIINPKKAERGSFSNLTSLVVFTRMYFHFCEF